MSIEKLIGNRTFLDRLARLVYYSDASPTKFAERCAYGATGLRFKIALYHGVQERNFWLEKVRATKGVNIEFETLPFGWHPSLSIPDLDPNLRLIVVVDPPSRHHMARHEDKERVLVIETDREANMMAWSTVRSWMMKHVNQLVP